MKRLAAIGLALALLAFGLPASAQSTVGVTPCVLSTSAAVGCKGGSGAISYIINNTLVAQTVTVTCTWPGGSLEVGALGLSQVITYATGPITGLNFTGGLTCTPSGSPAGVVNAGDGIVIWWSTR